MQAERHVVVLFTDIAGYTDYVSKKGNRSAIELLYRHNALLRPVIEQFGGTFVKSTGDGLIAYFEQPRQAIDAAVVIQQRLAAFNMERREDEEIHIRAALHIGSAIVEEGEIIGTTVNLSARLVAICKRDQIVISGDLYRRVRRAKHLTFMKLGHVALQGIPSKPEVYEVSWQLIKLEEKKKAAFVPFDRIELVRRRILTALAVTLSILILALLWVYVSPNFFVSRETLSTNSQEAKQLYTQALEYELKGDDEQAIQALQQALSFDPNFGEAHLELALLFYDIEEEAIARTHAQTAKKLSQQLPEDFKLKVRALLALLDGNSEKAVQIFQLLVDRYPKDTDGLYYLAIAATKAGRLQQARSSLKKCIETERLNPYCHYGLMMMQVRNNNFDEVLKSYEFLRAQNVYYVWLDVPASLALWGKDDLSRATRKLESLATARVGGIKTHGTIHFQTSKAWLVDIAIYQGKLAKAVQLLERLLTEATTEDVRINTLLYITKINDILGRKSNVITDIRKSPSIDTDPALAFRVAKTFAHLGEADEVKIILGRLESMQQTQTSIVDPASNHLFRGALALDQNRLSDAAEEVSLSYELSSDLDTLQLLTRIYMAQREWQAAARLAQEMIQYKGRILADYSPLIWPLAHYNLAVCYDKLGDPKRAVEYYPKFLQLWSSSDPNLQPVRDAQNRLAVLQETVGDR